MTNRARAAVALKQMGATRRWGASSTSSAILDSEPVGRSASIGN